MRATSFTALCAPLTASSPRSILQAQVLALARAPSSIASTRRGRSSETTLIRAMYFTASSWEASRALREGLEAEKYQQKHVYGTITIFGPVQTGKSSCCRYRRRQGNRSEHRQAFR